MRTFIFLSILLFFSHCLEKKQDNAGEIIDELTELHTIIGTPKPDLGRLINTIKNSEKNSRHVFDKFFKSVKGNCKTGGRLLVEFMAKIKGDIVSAKAGINRAHDRIKKNTKAITKLTKQIKKHKEQLINAHRRHGKEAKQFQKTLLEAEAKIITIKHVRNIVVDELLNGKAPASLIQVQTINTNLNQLKTQVQNDNDSIFSTVINTLLEMTTEQNLNNQKILRKFLGALRTLNNRIRAWIKKSKQQYRRVRKLNLATKLATLTSLRAFGKLYVEARSSLIAAKRTIEEFKNAGTISSKGLARKNKELENGE